MPKYNSGRVKRFDQTGITSDRYQYLGLEQAEPDLGDPTVGVSSIGVNIPPPGEQYVLAAVKGQIGKRYWITPPGVGAQGLQGTQGYQGTQGLQGAIGIGSTGSTGSQGVQGAYGSQGTQGLQGLQGPLSNFQGTQGLQGTQGTQGLQGNQGVQGFLSNFQGTQGSQGTQGIQGTQGTQGTQGRQGSQGVAGSSGIDGSQGSQGTQGMQGTQGLQGFLSNFQGTQGSQSTQGLQGTQGTQGSQSTQGVIGSQGYQGIQGVGSQGSQGLSNQGTQGSQGTIGSQGFQGLQGVGTQGTQGIQGSQGSQGSQGVAGSAGSTGSQGTQGIQGTQGLSGLFVGQGAQGLQGGGTQGVQGTQGLAGLFAGQGAQGIQNTQGTQGTQGVSNQGSQGTQNTQGTQGRQGLQGNQGIQGPISNFQGAQGVQSSQGTQGTIGSQGIVGSQGFQGLQGVGSQGSQGLSNQGSQGIQNTQGTQGVQGSIGSVGTTGSQGAQGIQNTQGIQGLQGTQGIQSTQGTQGSQGLQGNAGTGGATGSQGAQGSQSSQGTQGRQGLQGTQGLSNQGSQGVQSSQGVQGLTGSSGGSGSQGAQGSQSIQGNQGNQGISNQGVQGRQGLQGAAGLSGTLGSQGAQGTQSAQGTQGVVGPGGTSSFAALDTSLATSLNVSGATLTNVSGIFGMTSTTTVPPQSRIGVFNGSGFNPRYIQTQNRVYLTSVSTLTYYVMCGGTNSSFINWGNTPSSIQPLYLEYSVDGTNFYSLDTVTTAFLNSYLNTGYYGNTWVPRTISSSAIPSAALSYAGVYLRFIEYNTGSSGTGDNWAVTALLAQLGGSGSSTTSAAGSTSLAVIDFSLPSSFTLEATNNSSSAKVTTIGNSGYNMTTSGSLIPNSTPIGLFGVSPGGYPRDIITNNKVYLYNISTLTYYVMCGGTNSSFSTWGNTPSSIQPLTLQYNAYSSNPTDSNWDTLDTVDTAFLNTYLNTGYYGNTWVPRTISSSAIPSAALSYAGVYLRFIQINVSSSGNTGDNWAFTSVLVTFSGGSSGNNGTGGNTSLALMDLSSSNNVTLRTTNNSSSAKVTTIANSGYNITSNSIVPSSTPIGLFGVSPGGYPRDIITSNRIYLYNIKKLYYYVMCGGTNSNFITWGNTPSSIQPLTLQYNTYSSDPNDGNWTTLDTVTTAFLNTYLNTGYYGNTWVPRTIDIPSSAKSYAGVYLRFVEINVSSSGTGDNWAFTSIIGLLGDPNSSTSSSGGRSVSNAIIDLSSPNNVTLEATNGNSSAKVTTIANSGYNITSNSIVPSSTPIGLFGVSPGGYPRDIITSNRIYLYNIKKLYYYVMCGGTNSNFITWGNTPSSIQPLTLQYNTYSSDPNDGNWTTLDTVTTAFLNTYLNTGYYGNTWVPRTIDIPSSAKSYAGVYLRFVEINVSSSGNTGDNWAFTSVLPEYEDYSSSIKPGPFTVFDFSSLDGIKLQKNSSTDSSSNILITTPTNSGQPINYNTTVPSSTPIAIFGLAATAYPRNVTTSSRVYLTTVSTLNYYVMCGGTNSSFINWGGTPSSIQTLYLEYNVYSSDPADGNWKTLDTVATSFLNSYLNTGYYGNTWVPRTVDLTSISDLRSYAGVYLRFVQYNASSTYYANWAVTSIVATPTGGVSITNSSSSSTFYPTSSSSTSGTQTSLTVASSALTFQPSTGTLTATIVADAGGNLRTITNNDKTSAYTLAIGDIGELINITTGGVTVPSGVFSAGQAITIYNNSGSSQTITQGTSVTMYLVGTSTTGNRTLAQRGVCTVLCVASNTFVISGGGLT